MIKSSRLRVNNSKWRHYPFYLACGSVAVVLLVKTEASLPVYAQSPPPWQLVEAQTSDEMAYPDYLLGSGDEITITVFDYSEFSGVHHILPDGSLSLPLVGRVMTAGKTPDQLSEELAGRLNVWLRNPVVNVSLVTPRPISVNVSGAVMHPGPVRLEDGQDALRVSEALVSAGGITQRADLRQVTLRRYHPNGEISEMALDLLAAVTSDNPPPDLLLRDGDALFIPESNGLLEPRLIARSSFAPAIVKVKVVGEVIAPGDVEVPPGSSLSAAIATAGGPTIDARLSSVTHVHMNVDGDVDTQIMDLSTLSDNYQVAAGDVIIVPKKESSNILDYAGRILFPFRILNDIFGD
ncbi:MAG: polysaccharide biosynthesis/export family protein [Cyanobacteria bacterium P01_B01_bin.77]